MEQEQAAMRRDAARLHTNAPAQFEYDFVVVVVIIVIPNASVAVAVVVVVGALCASLVG